MELPKNITQIGEVGKDCKIYVEDYVISYMKQLNQLALDKDITLALYGRRREENGVAYFFLFGACKITSLQREVRHLSQAQRQEIESLRRKYFPEYTFLGYRLLNGEMVEGFHICEQEICRYITGYAQFYEKNDSMLAYMLAVRDEAAPEKFDQEKYEEVKHRQEERRAAALRLDKGRRAFKKKSSASHTLKTGRQQSMRLTVAGVFVLLCLAGVFSLQERARREGIDDIQASARQWLANLNEPSPADAPDGAVAVNANVKKDTLVLEDKLEQALLEENRHAKDTQAAEPTPAPTVEPTAKPTAEPTAEPTIAPTAEPTTEPTAEPVKESAAEKASSSAVAYVVRNGDTLSGISVRQYGSDGRVADICSLNKISDPDDIKVGQVIMLPK